MKYFSWENFDNEFLKAVIYSPETDESIRPVYATEEKEDLVCSMNLICDRPDSKFIKKYRQLIEDKLLTKYPDLLEEIFDTLKISGLSFDSKLQKLSQKTSSTSIIIAYITAILKIGGVDAVFSETSKFRFPLSLNISRTSAEEVNLYDFQKSAVNKLSTHFIENNNKSGLLVMPTGSGKSRTSAYFLIKKMISQGYQILWIVHRHMLIDQAADCFYKFAGLSKLENHEIKKYSICCISSEHQNIKAVDEKHTVLVASIQSLCRNQKHLRRITSKKLMIVVDEAHHTFARSYRDTLKFLFKYRPDAKLLGLTATPVRSNDADSSTLLRLFDNNIIYSVPMSKLIAEGVLAEPVFTQINTNEDFEPVITEDEAQKIKRYGELPESLLNKIAVCASRNGVIVSEYLKNSEKYGKTIIFCLNILHCNLLCKELRKHKVRCDCIYSGKEDNSYVIEQFKKGQIDVLINVNIMTEGSDVPDIETVFLTRPTQSEGLLMQMIGRGMRGVQARGTEKVNLVDFNDRWHVFNKWLNPQWLFEPATDTETEPDEGVAEIIPQKHEISWKLCIEAYNILSQKLSSYNRIVTLPSCWYSLIDEDGFDYTLLVFEDQLPGFVALMKDKKKILSAEKTDPQELINKYFHDFCLKPSVYEIALFIDNLKNFEEEPTIHLLADRKKFDPYYVAKKAKAENLNVFDLAKEVFDLYPVTEELFSSWENYATKVSFAYIYDGKEPAYGAHIEELPDEQISFNREPHHNLDELVQQVKDEMFNGKYDGISSYSWTDKAYKQYFGWFNYSDNSIKINCVLNSENVPAEVVKFVIYHEMLHRDIKGHGKDFKELEHRFKNYEQQEYFLHGVMNKFEISEW